MCVCGGRGGARVCVCALGVGGGGGRVCAGGDMKLGPTDFHAYATLPDKHSKSYQKRRVQLSTPVPKILFLFLFDRQIIEIYNFADTTGCVTAFNGLSDFLSWDTVFKLSNFLWKIY